MPGEKLADSYCGSQYTSEVGSYSCTSNIERMKRKTNRELYPSRLLVMRHSERVDELFPEWTHKCGQNYEPYDANMPLHLPIDRPLHDYLQDTPITVTGQVLARLVGRGMVSQGIVPDVIYSSPAIRSIQTANAVRIATGSQALLRWDEMKNVQFFRIEPGLFENTSLYPDMAPCLASISQLTNFPIDTSYRSLYSTTKLFTCSENIHDYNNRIYSTLRKISLSTEACDGEELNILIVGHASTVDMAVGLLRQKQRQATMQDLKGIGVRVPFCSVAAMERIEGQRGWLPNPYCLPPVSYRDLSNAYNQEFVNRL